MKKVLTNNDTLAQIYAAQAMMHAGFRCQICNKGENLRVHCRATVGYRLNNLLVLCSDCYEIAQVCKRKRMQSTMGFLLRAACITSLLLANVALILFLTSHLLLPLALLYVASIYAAHLLEKLSSRWF